MTVGQIYSGNGKVQIQPQNNIRENCIQPKPAVNQSFSLTFQVTSFHFRHDKPCQDLSSPFPIKSLVMIEGSIYFKLIYQRFKSYQSVNQLGETRFNRPETATVV